jgi:hypothetical protein
VWLLVSSRPHLPAHCTALLVECMCGWLDAVADLVMYATLPCRTLLVQPWRALRQTCSPHSALRARCVALTTGSCYRHGLLLEAHSYHFSCTSRFASAPLTSSTRTLRHNPMINMCVQGIIMKAANNACWAVGEMALKLPPGSTTAWAEPMAERLTFILTTGPSRLPRSLIDNAAITLGRLAASSPPQLAQHLPHYCTAWCQGLRNIRDDVEKETAFTGLCAVLRLNPAPAMPPSAGWAALASAVASWRTVNNAALKAEMAAVMQAYKQSLSAQGAWQQALSALDAPLAQKLCAMCEL